jgi:hypothetical protein
MTRFVAQPGSHVSIKGGNDIHEFDIQGKEIQGMAEFGADFHTMNTKSVALGKIPARIEGFIPVRSLHYGARSMDKSLYYHLKEETNPRILFRFSDLILKAMPDTNGAPYVFDSRCELVVAGVTNQISMPINILPFDDGKLKITASASAKMSDFGIQPPRLQLANTDARHQYINYRDEIELSIEWRLKRQPASAAKEKP